MRWPIYSTVHFVSVCEPSCLSLSQAAWSRQKASCILQEYHSTLLLALIDQLISGANQRDCQEL